VGPSRKPDFTVEEEEEEEEGEQEEEGRKKKKKKGTKIRTEACILDK
jgi:hypothetical protein